MIANMKNMKKRHWLLALVGAACVVAWVALGIGLVAGVDTPTRLVLVIAAAVTGELLLWTSAAVIGISVVEARARLWARVKGWFVRG